MAQADTMTLHWHQPAPYIASHRRPGRLERILIWILGRGGGND
jgi:hypothetical protein